MSCASCCLCILAIALAIELPYHFRLVDVALASDTVVSFVLPGAAARTETAAFVLTTLSCSTVCARVLLSDDPAATLKLSQSTLKAGSSLCCDAELQRRHSCVGRWPQEVP